MKNRVRDKIKHKDPISSLRLTASNCSVFKWTMRQVFMPLLPLVILSGMLLLMNDQSIQEIIVSGALIVFSWSVATAAQEIVESLDGAVQDLSNYRIENRSIELLRLSQFGCSFLYLAVVVFFLSTKTTDQLDKQSILIISGFTLLLSTFVVSASIYCLRKSQASIEEAIERALSTSAGAHTP